MRLFDRVPDDVRPTYSKFLAYALFRAPGQAMMVGLASLIAVKSLGAPPWEVALLAAALPFGNLLAIFWTKWITRAANKIPFAVWPEVCSSAVLISIALARDSHAFAILLCLFLLMRAPIIQAHSAILRANYPARQRSTLLARILSRAQILIAASGYAFGVFLEGDPMVYRFLFPMAGMCGLLAAFQISRIRMNGTGKENANGSPPVDFSLRRIMGVLKHDHRFLRYETAFFLFGFANIMTLPIIPLFLEHDLGIRYSEAGVILVTLPMILNALVMPLWGRRLDRHNPLLMRAIFNAIFSCGMLVYWLAKPIPLLALNPALVALCIFACGRVIIAFVQGGSALVWILGINYFARREEVPAYMGIHQSLTGLRGLIAPFVGIGLAALFGNRAVFLAAFLLMNAGTLVMIREVRGERRRLGGRLPSYAQAERQVDTRFSA